MMEISFMNVVMTCGSMKWYKLHIYQTIGSPLWSSDQNSCVRFPGLPNFLRSSWSGTGSTEPHEDN
jgi:hypothetical protein